MFAFAAFIEFESTVIFRDEAKTPDRTIPKASYTAVIGVGVFYTITAVVIGINFPFLGGDVNAKGAPVFGAVSAILHGLILVFPVAGLIQAAVLKRRNAPAYESITYAIAG